VHERLLSVENASIAFGSGSGRVPALTNVSLAFAPSALTLVTGPSGSGKTMLPSLLGCLLAPDTGSVHILEMNAVTCTAKKRSALRRQEIGFIFQAFRLFHPLSAIENVLIKADVANVALKDSQRSACDLLANMGLASKSHLKPDELSGGEKQRVAITRAR
jgi:putative ABC transport system ATP-binding protein